MRYSGQALAIVLVLLLVGSIIGFALYARTIREAERTVGERAAAESNELVETTIGLVSTSEYQQLKVGFIDFVGDCEEDNFLDQGCRENNMNVERVETFFEEYLLLDNADLSKFDRDLDTDYCLTEMALKYITPSDDVIIQQDDAFGFFLHKADWDAGCEVSFVMSNGDASGFTLSEFYAEHDSDDNVLSYKNYKHDDIKGYLYSGSGENWSSPPSSFVYKSSNASKEGNFLHELRFKSLGGWSRLSWDIADSCDLEDYFLMEVGSTCGGKYVGKNFIVPADLFAPPIFDYVLFNGVGEIKPESIDPELLQ